MGPRKQPSGAAKRKAKAQRQFEAQDSQLIMAKQWTSQSLVPMQSWDPNGPPIELPIYGQPPATAVRAVANALLALEQGQFYQAAYLWDGMMRDDRLAATLGVRIDALVGAKLTLDPAYTDDDEAEEADDPEGSDATQTPAEAAQCVAEQCQRQISRIMPSHQLYELMRWAIGISVGLAQVTSTRTTKTRTPTFRVWNPRQLRFDWGLRQYRLITENRGEITIERDDPEWLLYEPYGPYGWLHGAALRAVAQPWLIRYWTRMWWSRHQEVHGQPIRLGIIPAERTPVDEATFLRQISTLGHEAVIRLPQGQDGNRFDMKLLEATANTWQGFEKLLQHCDDSIAIYFLGQRQSTDGQGGLGATENAGESTMVKKTRKDALVGEVLRDQLLKPWAKDNFGDEELAPYLNWNIEPPEDEGEAAKTDLAVGQALVAFKAAGAPIDVRAYLEERGYALLTEEQHAAQKQEAVEAAQAAMGSQPPAGDGKETR